jgi:hypothetical protein
MVEKGLPAGTRVILNATQQKGQKAVILKEHGNGYQIRVLDSARILVKREWLDRDTDTSLMELTSDILGGASLRQASREPESPEPESPGLTPGWTIEGIEGEAAELIGGMMENTIGEVKKFMAWAASIGVTVLFEAGKGKGVAGETFLQARPGPFYMDIDNVENPFVYWDRLKKDTPYRIRIQLNRSAKSQVLGDAMHELIVHAMQYQPLIAQFRQTDNTTGEIPLLYHAHLHDGRISAVEHHKKHGSKVEEEPLVTKAGKFQPSGYDAFNEQVKHIANVLLENQKGKAAGELLEAVTKDVAMQGEDQGNLEAPFAYTDHSLGLMIGYLVDKASLPKLQRESCDITMGSLTTAWLATLDRYKTYKISNNEAPYTSQSDTPSGKYGRFKKKDVTKDFKNWLIFQPENILETLLEHLALSGDALTTDFSKDKKSPVAGVKKDLVPGLKSNDIAQSYAAFRVFLEKARGVDPAPWTKLLEALKAFK